VLLLLGLAALVLLIAVAVWLAIALALVAAVVWLNLVLLPRLSRRLHVPRLPLDLACLVLLAAPGWLLGGTTGAALGALAWLAGVGVPRLVGQHLRARIRRAASGPGTVIVVESRALPNRAAVEK
jgi:hypothetical protein